MAAMTNLTVSYSGTSYTWTASTPGGATEPARWRGPSLAPANVASRSAQANLSYKYHRNSANTADRFVVSGYVPIVCNGEDACIPTQQGRVPFNFTVVLPDVLSDQQRSDIINVVTHTLANNALISTMISGEGMY